MLAYKLSGDSKKLVQAQENGIGTMFMQCVVQVLLLRALVVLVTVLVN